MRAAATLHQATGKAFSVALLVAAGLAVLATVIVERSRVDRESPRRRTKRRSRGSSSMGPAGRGLVIIWCHGTVGHSARSCFVSEPLPLGVVALVEFVRSLPYGRPSRRTSACMLAERKGTCSTKHAFLYDVIEERYPELEPRLVHRVYRVTRAAALATYGEAAAATVPADGLVDVHRYLELAPARERIRVDATFAGLPWDGASSMELACGPGEDHPVTGDRDAEKRALEARFCDPAVREPFIAALAARHPRR